MKIGSESQQGPKKTRPGIVPRKLALGFSPDIPRYWCNGSAFMTHMLNTYTLLVPDNENYYIRQLDKCIDDIEDATLVDELRRFCRQEAEHGKGHKAYWRNIEAQGLRTRGFVKAVGWFNYKLLEPLMPRAVHLANIACIEHINAYLGQFYLQHDLLAESDTSMKALFYWHFAEEIEHKNVAFDAYQHLYGNYLLRLLGAALVFPLFYTINTGGTLYMLWQDKRLFRLQSWKDYYRYLFKQGALSFTLLNILRYLKPGFHPSQIANSDLAWDFFANAQNQHYLKEFPAS